MRGKLIVFEGLDGSGKTTQIRLLARWLRAKGLDVLLTRQPGGTPLGRILHRIIRRYHMSAEAEFLLYSADRAEHIRRVVRPALESGKLVLTDRWIDSTVAYQGYGRGLSWRWLEEVSRPLLEPIPDVVFILLLPPEEARARVLVRSSEKPDRLELESLSFYRRVYDGYLRLAEQHLARYVLVDATRGVKDVQQSIRAELARRHIV